jgi:hypothetical protein
LPEILGKHQGKELSDRSIKKKKQKKRNEEKRKSFLLQEKNQNSLIFSNES